MDHWVSKNSEKIITKNQFITDEGGKKAGVLLPVKDYEKMLDDLDEYACIKAYDKVNSRKMEFATAEEMFNAIEKKRKYN